MPATHATKCMDRTTISVSEEVADTLHGLKERGESYDDVLRRVLSEIGEDVDSSENSED